VGDSQDGRIGAVEFDTYSEYDAEIIRVFSTIPMANQSEALSVPELELTMEAGVGGFELDPQVRLSWSDDGSKTFNNELSRGIGKVGQYLRRAKWYRLGRIPKHRVFKFEFSEKVKFVVAKLEARVRGGQRGR